ncbi:MAG: hypothetical protein H6585_03280 [Flavobacteriales bacterium]|nr:hypothetical protein [Flavobacteriales bacterium]MCB9447351.1 hypothetical protein [Flavobacteriales bacterium]
MNDTAIDISTYLIVDSIPQEDTNYKCYLVQNIDTKGFQCFPMILSEDDRMYTDIIFLQNNLTYGSTDELKAALKELDEYNGQSRSALDIVFLSCSMGQAFTLK